MLYVASPVVALADFLVWERGLYVCRLSEVGFPFLLWKVLYYVTARFHRYMSVLLKIKALGRGTLVLLVRLVDTSLIEQPEQLG